jgi:outer membrane protein assembly factor BamE (lipoprotein component of BamABCDE complex)
MILKYLIIAGVLAFFTACTDSKNIQTPYISEQITVAKAQHTIKKGMTSIEVIELIGSPNIISTNQLGNEIWVYDKVSTHNDLEKTSIGAVGFIPALFIKGNTSISKNTSYQKTLTIIIKYDKNKKVNNISYHTTRF